MIDTILVLLTIFIVGLFSFIIFGGLFAGICDWKNPPKPINYVWRDICVVYNGEYGGNKYTRVYVDYDTNWICGKVVKTEEGLFRATMWNGHSKEFLYEYEAKKSVEEYEVHIVK